MAKAPSKAVLSFLRHEFPAAKCALDFKNDFECLCAVVLSAQTTDKAVNAVTPRLFRDFPTPQALSAAPVLAVENDLRSLGLYHNKSRNLIALSAAIQNVFAGKIPQSQTQLMELPGVGRKTSGVFLAERFSIPAIPVDTHITRVALRLGFAKNSDSPDIIERRLEREFTKSDWIFLHHALIEFGRTVCHAKNPDCVACGLAGECPYFRKHLSTKGK